MIWKEDIIMLWNLVDILEDKVDLMSKLPKNPDKSFFPKLDKLINDSKHRYNRDDYQDHGIQKLTLERAEFVLGTILSMLGVKIDMTAFKPHMRQKFETIGIQRFRIVEWEEFLNQHTGLPENNEKFWEPKRKG